MLKGIIKFTWILLYINLNGEFNYSQVAYSSHTRGPDNHFYVESNKT